MSNAIFPTLTASQGVIKGYPFKKWHEFSTLLDTPGSNRGEFADSLTPYPIWNFELDVPFLTGSYGQPNSAFALAVGFHMQMRGSYDSFLYLDSTDNAVTTPSQFATGDSSTTSFWITRTIGGGGIDAIQNINGVVTGTPGPAPSIFDNGVLKTAGTDYTISQTGVVTFTSAPASGHALTWTGTFYFRCRFKDDALSDLEMVSQNGSSQVWQCKTYAFRSIIL